MTIFFIALILFLLAFCALSIGILLGRKGISGSCSSGVEGIDCLCGGDSQCTYEKGNNHIVCAVKDAEECQKILQNFENQLRQRDSERQNSA